MPGTLIRAFQEGEFKEPVGVICSCRGSVLTSMEDKRSVPLLYNHGNSCLLLKPSCLGDEVLDCQGALSQVKACPEGLPMSLDVIMSFKTGKDLWE